MKNVRIIYEKTGGMRFCSHLDITRFMARIIRKADLPVWYTEGFNPHLYLTFALPLPLGFTGKYEVMDIRLTDDNYDISSIPELLNSFCPPDIRFFSAKEPVFKAGEVKSADYTVAFDDDGKVSQKLREYLQKDTLIITKKTKRGEEKQFEIKDKIKNVSLLETADGTELKLNLPAGGDFNVNPDLILAAFYEESKIPYYCYTVTRTAIRTADGTLFE